MKLEFLLCCVLLLTNVTFAEQPGDQRASSWASPITLAGVPNLHKIDKHLYRSAQPSALGVKNLEELGIKTIINLRTFHSDRLKLLNSPIEYEHIYMKTWHPEREDIVRFLKIVTDPSRSPVLLHCQHGADRTGVLSAIYRVAVQGWTKEDAIAEMKGGNFGFHEIWGNLVVWFTNLDINSIKKEAGILRQPYGND